jgi:hypothetical protein
MSASRYYRPFMCNERAGRGNISESSAGGWGIVACAVQVGRGIQLKSGYQRGGCLPDTSSPSVFECPTRAEMALEVDPHHGWMSLSKHDGDDSDLYGNDDHTPRCIQGSRVHFIAMPTPVASTTRGSRDLGSPKYATLDSQRWRAVTLRLPSGAPASPAVTGCAFALDSAIRG